MSNIISAHIWQLWGSCDVEARHVNGFSRKSPHLGLIIQGVVRTVAVENATLLQTNNSWLQSFLKERLCNSHLWYFCGFVLDGTGLWIAYRMWACSGWRICPHRGQCFVRGFTTRKREFAIHRLAVTFTRWKHKRIGKHNISYSSLMINDAVSAPIHWIYRIASL